MFWWVAKVWYLLIHAPYKVLFGKRKGSLVGATMGEERKMVMRLTTE